MVARGIFLIMLKSSSVAATTRSRVARVKKTFGGLCYQTDFQAILRICYIKHTVLKLAGEIYPKVCRKKFYQVWFSHGKIKYCDVYLIPTSLDLVVGDYTDYMAKPRRTRERLLNTFQESFFLSRV